MRKTKHLLATMAVLLCSLAASAHDFEVGGIYYNITSNTDKTVVVTFRGDYENSYKNEYTGSITIPTTVTYNGVDYRVVGIGTAAFRYCTTLISITIPEGVRSIGDQAFRACNYLTTVVIPESVKNIGKEAFYECSRLTSIIIPEGVAEIGNYTFYNCSSLASVRIPESVTSIGASAFYGCSSLSSIKIPEKVTVIEEYTFYNCSSLTSIRIPDAVERINMYAFRDCSSLAIVTIGKSVTSINGSSFQYGCRNIHTVINYSTFTITPGSSGFGYVAYSAKKVFNMSTLDNIENFLFYTKDGIHYLAGYIGGEEQINLPMFYEEETYQIAPYAFYNCNSLTVISIPQGVTDIGNWAFSGCSNLTDLTLHSNLVISASGIPSATKVTLVLNDGEAADFNAANANTFDEVVYNRELGAGKYGTIMLPFAPDTESVESFAFYSLSSVDGETLIFDEVATPLANTPYLYALREGKSATQITGGETTIASAIATPEIDGWKTVGSFINQTVDCSSGDACYYAINAADNMLYNVVSKLNVKPYRAYFEGRAANAAQLRIRTRDGKETVIDAAEVEDLVPVTYYDLCGRRVASPNKGVYIVNGKKMMVK